MNKKVITYVGIAVLIIGLTGLLFILNRSSDDEATTDDQTTGESNEADQNSGDENNNNNDSNENSLGEGIELISAERLETNQNNPKLVTEILADYQDDFVGWIDDGCPGERKPIVDALLAALLWSEFSVAANDELTKQIRVYDPLVARFDTDCGWDDTQASATSTDREDNATDNNNETGNSNETQPDPVDDSSEAEAGLYLDYSSADFNEYANKERWLFFHANWCPLCVNLEEDILAHLSDIPDDVVIFKVDFDNSDDLRNRYGVSIQTTIVSVDGDGDKIKSHVASLDQSLFNLIVNLS